MVETRDNSIIIGGKPSWAYPSHPSDDAIAKFFTKSALDFAPTNQEIFITNSKGDSQRLIFHEPQELKDYEKDHLIKFREYLKDNGLTIPGG